MIDRNIPFYNLILKCTEPQKSNISLPDGYSIRTYRAGDEHAWAMLEYEIGDFRSVRDAESYFLSKYSDTKELKKRCVFLLNEKEDIIGSCMAWKDKKKNKTVASIHWLVISPPYQGLKLSKPLLQKVMNIFCDNNENIIYIHTQPWSYVAVLLYIRNGFKIQKNDTFAHYTNEYNNAMTAIQPFITKKMYEELQLNSED